MFFNWWSWLKRFEIIRWISLLPFTCLDVVATRPRWDHFLSPGPMLRQNSNVNCVTTGHDFLLLLLLRFNGSLHPCCRITAIFWIYLTPAVPGSWMYSILSDFSYQSCSLKKFHQTLSICPLHLLLWALTVPFPPPCPFFLRHISCSYQVHVLLFLGQSPQTPVGCFPIMWRVPFRLLCIITILSLAITTSSFLFPPPVSLSTHSIL